MAKEKFRSFLEEHYIENTRADLLLKLFEPLFDPNNGNEKERQAVISVGIQVLQKLNKGSVDSLKDIITWIKVLENNNYPNTANAIKNLMAHYQKGEDLFSNDDINHINVYCKNELTLNKENISPAVPSPVPHPPAIISFGINAPAMPAVPTKEDEIPEVPRCK